MKNKINPCLCFFGIFTAILFSNCTAAGNFDFSLKNTVAIFLLNNGNDYYFCIPVQYMGDYQVEKFEFAHGNIQIGEYEILLKRDELNIYAYLNEATDDLEGSGVEFDLVYSEENGKIAISKMSEPLTVKRDSDEKINHYYIFIEKFLTNDEMKKISAEYKKGNVNSRMTIWYDITIDNELQAGSGMLDDFELSNEPFMDNAQFFPNLNFFRAAYLQK